MFTGIIETLGKIQKIERENSNVHFTVASSLSHELKIDQSVAHNGVCLTVVEMPEGAHVVTAIEETLKKSNLNDWKVGTLVNIERCMQMNGRLDGHIVQGHVDATAKCIDIKDENGSWEFRFEYPKAYQHLIVDKGSVCINGTSLTVVNPKENQFSVAIIPFTFEHTNFQSLQVGDAINIEFDLVGKYLARYIETRGV